MNATLDRFATELRREVRGPLLMAGDAGYDDARRIWNAMIDRRPALVVRCADVDDVARTIDIARRHALGLSIRGGGHNIAGNAVCDGGVMADLSAMKEVRVDAARRRAWVGPGATLADVDAATQAHALAVPLGINSTTGVAGLTLGGGFGWLTRRLGMTVDNLLSAQVVTADGQRLVASDGENPDLFWAIRGGGGNFGVVTEFEFALHPVGPQVLAGVVAFPFAQAKQVLARYREFAAVAPEEMTAWIVLRQAPPLPFLSADVHGTHVVLVPAIHSGDATEGEAQFAALRRLGDPLGEHVGVQPYTQWQQAFDPLLTPGSRNYWKSHNFTELSDGALEAILAYADRLPSPQCEIFIGHIAGAPNRVAPDAMAYGNRDTRFVMNVHGRWEDAGLDRDCIAWTRAVFDAAAPYASSGAYVNFMTADEADRVRFAYGGNYARLAQIKKRYDPDNVFRFNQNIRP